MKAPTKEARRWLAQAENDLKFAQFALKGKFYDHVCFVSQQSAEKALKALSYLRGERFVPGHSVLDLVNRLRSAIPELAGLEEGAGLLDQYYIPTRYPNGLPDGAPFQVYTRQQAEKAIENAEAVLKVARDRVTGRTS